MDAPHIDREDSTRSKELSLDEWRELLSRTRENNHILHQMQFWGRIAFWFKVAVWAVALSIPVLLYSYFAPLLHFLPGIGVENASSTSPFSGRAATEFQNAVTKLK